MFNSKDLPQTADYISVIKDLAGQLSHAQEVIFRTQYSSPGRSVTSQDLCKALGYSGIAASNLAYGTLGRLLGEKMNFDVSDRPSSRPGWWRVLSTGDGSGNHFSWILLPQLATALEQAGIVDPRDDGIVCAPDVDFNSGIGELPKEGRRRLVIHLRRERNRALIERKKAFASSNGCEVCGFDSLEKYGVQYIEAHHLKPLGSLEEEDEAQTTLDDLALVCASCHRIIHSFFPPLGLADVSRMIEDRKQNRVARGINSPRSHNTTHTGP